VILDCNFEELQALTTGAELLLGFGHGGSVAAPSEALAPVAQLQPRLSGALQIETFSDQQLVRRAVATICQRLHQRMDQMVLEYHPAHEEAVALYFDYAHAYSVLRRLDEMGTEMSAMIELITGAPVDSQSASSVTFPD
jgi:hypothetical protein